MTGRDRHPLERELARRMERELGDLGLELERLQGRRAYLLAYLARCEGRSTRELAAACGLSAATVSRIVRGVPADAVGTPGGPAREGAAS